MPLLIDPADAAEVRAILDVSLDEAAVSDDTILRDIYAGRASDIVLRWRDQLVPTLPDDDLRLRRAAVLMTAALLAPSISVLVSERLPDYSYQRASVNRADQSSVLESQAYGLITDLVADDTLVGPQVFDVAKGSRGALIGTRWPEGASRPGPLW